jgi:phage shock protein C
MSDEIKRLYRSKSERMIGGVCGGIAAYFSIDPTLIRILFIIFGLAVGGGILLYLILWLLIPEEPAMVEPVVEAHPEED